MNGVNEDASDVAEVFTKLVFSFSSFATQNMVCPNLNFAFTAFEGRVTAKAFCTKVQYLKTLLSSFKILFSSHNHENFV